MVKQTKNVKELREDLLEAIQDLKDKKIGVNELKERSKSVGAVIATCKIQIEYNKYVGAEDKQIEFLHNAG